MTKPNTEKPTINRLIIIGAGGHGRVVADCALATGQYQEIRFLDDCYPERKDNALWSIVGTVKEFTQYLDEAHFIVAFGNNKLREKVQSQLHAANANIVTIIHPQATVSPHAHIGLGVVVCANATINIGATINDGCIINTASTIEHDCNIGEFTHISPNCALAGGITVGKLSWLGINSTVIECLTIAPNTQVGAGAVVISNTDKDSLYLGIPAKRISPTDKH
ncbi:acetyltransferase [Thalassotalea profundi]|uniref:Acetyltransferase n=1 Tax=Thalassotalea profundi TaxID=2036687 RepID=A0ABQ3IST9_9GAMM|nr:acetyltransferase [Thalassotalea profundi]GHE89792.1 acetyltransferase [Thalassotalea profundi]